MIAIHPELITYEQSFLTDELTQIFSKDKSGSFTMLQKTGLITLLMTPLQVKGTKVTTTCLWEQLYNSPHQFKMVSIKNIFV